nr:unnamed protein product [Digitaria exilis]
MAPTPRSPLRAAALFVLLVGVAFLAGAGGTEVLSKSRLERCERDSDAGGALSCKQKLVLNLAVPAGSVLSKSRLERCERDSDAGGALSCKQKLVLNLAVPAGSSGGEASLVTKVVDAENGTEAATRSIQDPPVVTIEKTAVSAVYAINYLMDVAYRPEERVVETRKCEPDAGANVVGGCERLWNGNGAVIEHTEVRNIVPVCISFPFVVPVGLINVHHHLVETFVSLEIIIIPSLFCFSTIPNSSFTLVHFVVDKMVKGKRNTAHCLRFQDDCGLPKLD